MITPRIYGACFIATCLSLACGTAARAQDIPARAQAMHRAVPSGYLERVRKQPDFFEIKHGWTHRNRSAVRFGGAPTTQLSPVTGTLRVAVVPVGFSDSPAPDVTTPTIQQRLFDGPNEFGTITEYYHEISRNAFTLTGVTSGWVRSSMTVAQVVGTSQGLGADAQTGQFLADGLIHADSTVDFSQFDNDGPDGIPNSGDDDGIADAVVFLENAIPASCGGPGIWPHRSSISGWLGQPYVTADTQPDGQPILVDDYIILGVHECADEPLVSSVMAHEMGHILGLPDLYDPINGLEAKDRRWVLGCWSLMAGGSWGCGDGSVRSVTNRPTHDSPWEKSRLGWLVADTVPEVRDATYTLSPMEEDGHALFVPLSSTEYYFIEYRRQESFDTDLPASGIMVYHVDLLQSIQQCPTCGRNYRVGVVEAEGDSSLVRIAAEGGDRGDAGDVFARNGRTDSLSNATIPSARLNLGGLTTVSISAMRIDASGNAQITLSTASTPAFVLEPTSPPVSAMDNLSIPMRVAGGALPYTWSVASGRLPSGLSVAGRGQDAALVGRPLQSGTFNAVIRATDALGQVADANVALQVSAVVIARDRVLQAFTRSDAVPLTADEKAYLDETGNKNGRYDVGDLRAWLNRN